MEKIRVFEAFAGYGSQSLALSRLRDVFSSFDYEVVGISEIDRFAIKAYNALHCDVVNYGDIEKIDWSIVPDFDLFTYSFPCTDISSAGEQMGFEEGSGTRSSLLWECRKAIIAKKPKYLLMENVVDIVSAKFRPLYSKWARELEVYGYKNYPAILDARDFGVPQSRKRVFLVSVLGDEVYHFPEPIKVGGGIDGFLEDMVNENYYFSDDKLKKCSTPTASQCHCPLISVNPFSRKMEFDANSSLKAVCPTLRATDYKGAHVVWESFNPLRIRKLTPKEYFRFMGVNDENIDKIQASGVSASQQYKMAGNSICVDVLFHIFRKMFCEKECEQKQLTLF